MFPCCTWSDGTLDTQTDAALAATGVARFGPFLFSDRSVLLRGNLVQRNMYVPDTAAAPLYSAGIYAPGNNTGTIRTGTIHSAHCHTG